MVRLACIGTNFITDWLLEGIREVEGIELSAVYSRTMEKGKEFAEMCIRDRRKDICHRHGTSESEGIPVEVPKRVYKRETGT